MKKNNKKSEETMFLNTLLNSTMQADHLLWCKDSNYQTKMWKR